VRNILLLVWRLWDWFNPSHVKIK